jgi:hypothetical protein
MALALQFFLNRRRMRSIEISATQATYPVGAHVKAAVNPGDPGRSVLEPGLRYDYTPRLTARLPITFTSNLSRSRRPHNPRSSTYPDRENCLNLWEHLCTQSRRSKDSCPIHPTFPQEI